MAAWAVADMTVRAAAEQTLHTPAIALATGRNGDETFRWHSKECQRFTLPGSKGLGDEDIKSSGLCVFCRLRRQESWEGHPETSEKKFGLIFKKSISEHPHVSRFLVFPVRDRTIKESCCLLSRMRKGIVSSITARYRSSPIHSGPMQIAWGEMSR